MREEQFVRCNNDFMRQGSFAKVHGCICHPIPEACVQSNATPGVQQQCFPSADGRQPQLIVLLFQFVLHAP